MVPALGRDGGDLAAAPVFSVIIARMSLAGMPILILNLGGEMIYILDQRLRAQNIPPDKSVKVLQDVVAKGLGFLQDKIQRPDGSYVVNNDGPPPPNTEVPGQIRSAPTYTHTVGSTRSTRQPAVVHPRRITLGAQHRRGVGRGGSDRRSATS